MVSPEVIVAGHLIVDPSQRDDYLLGCVDVILLARTTAGCLDFALSADAIDTGRINILERWESAGAVAAFRDSGAGGEQGANILAAFVAEYDVGAVRTLS